MHVSQSVLKYHMIDYHRYMIIIHARTSAEITALNSELTDGQWSSLTLTNIGNTRLYFHIVCMTMTTFFLGMAKLNASIEASSDLKYFLSSKLLSSARVSSAEKVLRKGAYSVSYPWNDTQCVSYTPKPNILSSHFSPLPSPFICCCLFSLKALIGSPY